MHYLGKIQEMEKELKKKEVVIGSYQARITELNHQLAGDSERIRLATKMKEELEKLQLQVAQQSTHPNYGELGLTTSPSLPSIVVSPTKVTVTDRSLRPPLGKK
jgi:chromosome segregation ATPase